MDPGIHRTRRRGGAARSSTYLLDRSLAADRPMIDNARAAPTARQLLRHRWRRLLAELQPTRELPAVRALARQLLARSENWQVPELPLYPAFR
jgi:hypothetical protein